MKIFPLHLVTLETKQVFNPIQIKIQKPQSSKLRDILLPIGGEEVITNQPVVALTTSNKEIVELILPFINNAWLHTDNL